MNTENITPLLAWLRAATVEQRERMALLAGTTTNYVYQLSTSKGKRGQRMSADLAFRLEDAMQAVEREYKDSFTPAPQAVTARELATMWQLAGL